MAGNNPFTPSFGNRPDKVVGRDSVERSIIEGLDRPPGARERCTLILGQRGMGKTALLLDLAEQMSRKGYVVARVSSGPSMLEDIIDAIQYNGSKLLHTQNAHLSGMSASALGFGVGLNFTSEAQSSYGFRTKLSMLCERLGSAGKGVCILIDEVQPDSDEMRQFASAYQLVVGDGRDVALTMAGLPSSISNVLNDRVLTFLNRATKVSLGPLSIPSIQAYYTNTFKELGIPFADDLPEKAAQATYGFPYLLQLIGYYLLEYASQDGIDQKVLELASASAQVDLEQNVLAAALRPLSNGDIEFLRAMAADDGVSKITNIEKRLGSKNRVQPYRKRLLDAGMVWSPRRGELAFTLPMLAEYLRSQKDPLFY